MKRIFKCTGLAILVGFILLGAWLSLDFSASQQVAIEGVYKAAGAPSEPVKVEIGNVIQTEIVSKAARGGLQDAATHLDALDSLAMTTQTTGVRDLKAVYEKISRNLFADPAMAQSVKPIVSEAVVTDLANIEEKIAVSGVEIAKAKTAEKNLSQVEQLLSKARTIAEASVVRDKSRTASDEFHSIFRQISGIVESGNSGFDAADKDFFRGIKEKLQPTRLSLGKPILGFEDLATGAFASDRAANLIYDLDGAIASVSQRKNEYSRLKSDLGVSLKNLQTQSSSLRAFQREMGSFTRLELTNSKFDIMEKSRDAALSQASVSEPIVLSMFGKKPASAVFSDYYVGDRIFLKSSNENSDQGYETMLFGVPEDANKDGVADIIDCLAIVRTYDAGKRPNEKVVVFSLERDS